jgi:hypothetical protein
MEKGDIMSTRQYRVEHRERMRTWRKEKAAAGGKTLSVPIDAETNRMIEELLWSIPGAKLKNKRVLVAEAVKCLYEIKIKENR